MSKKYYDIDTIDVIAEMVQINIDHFEKMGHMWYEESVANDTVGDDTSIEWQMWTTNMDKIAALKEVIETLAEFKEAEIYRRANVVFKHH